MSSPLCFSMDATTSSLFLPSAASTAAVFARSMIIEIVALIVRSFIVFLSRTSLWVRGFTLRGVRFRSVALFTAAKLAQSFPRVYSVVVTIAEHEFHTVTPDVFGVQHRQVIGYCSRIEYAQARHLADAIRAHAFGPQIFDRVDAPTTIVPSYSDLVPGLFYLERCRH